MLTRWWTLISQSESGIKLKTRLNNRSFVCEYCDICFFNNFTIDLICFLSFDSVLTKYEFTWVQFWKTPPERTAQKEDVHFESIQSIGQSRLDTGEWTDKLNSGYRPISRVFQNCTTVGINLSFARRGPFSDLIFEISLSSVWIFSSRFAFSLRFYKFSESTGTVSLGMTHKMWVTPSNVKTWLLILFDLNFWPEFWNSRQFGFIIVAEFDVVMHSSFLKNILNRLCFLIG